MSIDFSKDDGIDFSSDNIGAPIPAPKMIDYNKRAKEVKDNMKRQDKTYDEWAEADRALDNPVSTLMGAATLLDLTTEFLWYDGDGKKHYKGGEPPRVGLKVCIAKCGDCEVKSEPYMMKKDAKADACARLLQDVKQAYGDWTKIATNKGRGNRHERRMKNNPNYRERHQAKRRERENIHREKWSTPNIPVTNTPVTNKLSQADTGNSGGKWITAPSTGGSNRVNPYGRPVNTGPTPGALIGGPRMGWQPPGGAPAVKSTNSWKSAPQKSWKTPSVSGWKPPNAK